MMSEAWYFDCGQCGEIGLVSQLSEHPVRPVAMDIGFCPKCGAEIDTIVDEQMIRSILTEYGEDAGAFLAALAVQQSHPEKG